jgi:3-dehydroquinate synthase
MNQYEMGEGLTFSEYLPSKKVVIITDSYLKDIYSECFNLEGCETLLLDFESTEQMKTRDTKVFLEDQMLAYGVTRDWCVLAVGGGVITDLGGFVASTFLRGLPLVLAPTTLLGIVDATIGGKTALNTKYGKNLIGAFYPPCKVLIDLFFLKTLPKAQIQNGFAEMIKHGIALDKNHFEDLARDVDVLLHLKEPVFSKVVLESMNLKYRIVQEDSKESGIRRLLNFGHTLGHGLELCSNYTLSHGKAVAIGCIAEAFLSIEHAGLTENEYRRIKELFYCYFGTLSLSFKVCAKAMEKALKQDKKSDSLGVRSCFIKEIGVPLENKGLYCDYLQTGELERAVEVINALS